jgi:hypothetical protein
MQEIQDIFADRVGNIVVTGSVVRIDLMVVDPTSVPSTGGDQGMKFEMNRRLIMPMEGFVRSFSALESVIRKMVEAGVVNVQQPPGATAIGSAEPTVPAAGDKSGDKAGKK